MAERLSDEVLVVMVGRGDEHALTELYDRLGHLAYGLALRILTDERLAEDAVHEGFLDLVRTASTRGEGLGARAWVLRLVRRRAVALMHDEAEHGRSNGRPIASPAGGGTERVQVALQRLSRVEREAIEAAWYRGDSPSQLGERLGLPPATIKTTLRTGLARLHELLDDPGVVGTPARAA